MKTTLILFFIVFEVVISLFLGVKIHQKLNQNILGVRISTISKTEIIANTRSSLKYFYEPKSGGAQVVNLGWMGKGFNYSVSYEINNDDLNQKNNYEVSKPIGTYMIATLGDSFTFGQNVNTQDNYPTQLENLLNQNLKCQNIKQFQIINLGVYGYDLQYTLERYKLRGQKYDPDLILWLIPDFYRLDEQLLPKAKALEDEMRKTGEYNEELEKGDLYPTWHKAREEIIKNMGEDQVLKIQEQYLEGLGQYFGKTVILLSFQLTGVNEKNMLKRVMDTNPQKYFHHELPNIWQMNATLPDDHPNAKGYQIIAQDLFNYLTQNKIIPCN